MFEIHFLHYYSAVPAKAQKPGEKRKTSEPQSPAKEKQQKLSEAAQKKEQEKQKTKQQQSQEQKPKTQQQSPQKSAQSKGNWAVSSKKKGSYCLSSDLVQTHMYEPPHDKTNKMICALSEDLDQTGHLPSLIQSLRCTLSE